MKVPNTHSLSNNLLKLACVIITVFIAGCDGGDKIALYGSPTKLLPNESLVDAICRIQEEFRALPKPLMQKMDYQAGWTSYNFGAASTRHEGFYRVHLRPEALNFLRQHSRLELVASLVPLFIDPRVGGEAAVLLAGIPAGSDSSQGFLTRSIAQNIKSSRYKSPTDQGNWHGNSHQKYYIASSLYGLTNSTSRIHKKQLSDSLNSLEDAIIEVLTTLSHSPLIFLDEGYLRMPQPHTEDSVDSWISSRNVPLPNSKAQTFIDKYKGDFSTNVMLPMMPYPQDHLQIYEHYMMWLMGEEKEYWPAMLSLTSGKRKVNKLKNKFRMAYAEKAYKNCHEEKE